MARRSGSSPAPRSCLRSTRISTAVSLASSMNRRWRCAIAPGGDANTRWWPAWRGRDGAGGRPESRGLAFVPGAKPFDLFDPDRAGRIKLYVKRVFITDEAEILPRYLRFIRGLVDSTDLPLNVSREMIQESP